MQIQEKHMSKTFFSYAVAMLLTLGVNICATAQFTPPIGLLK